MRWETLRYGGSKSPPALRATSPQGEGRRGAEVVAPYKMPAAAARGLAALQGDKHIWQHSTMGSAAAFATVMMVRPHLLPPPGGARTGRPGPPFQKYQRPRPTAEGMCAGQRETARRGVSGNPMRVYPGNGV